MNTIKNRLTDEEKEQMARDNIKLVYHEVNKFKNVNLPYEEKVSAAMTAFAHSLNSFDPSLGIKISTYACRLMNRKLLNLIRDEKKRMRDISIETPIFKGSDGKEITILDNLSNNLEPKEVEDWNGVAAAINSICETLTDEEKVIFKSYYIQGKRQPEIAKMVGVAQVTVSRKLTKIIAKIKEEYARNQ